MKINQVATNWFYRVIAIIFLVSSTGVWAAERTACFRLQLKDDRFNCASQSETGSLRGCNNGGYVDAVGHHVELWDKDTGNDEYIGTWYIGSGGTQCITFEWENASYSRGEANPDTYIRYDNVVNRVGYSNYIHVEAVRTDGSKHADTSWVNGSASDPDRYVARNCRAGSTCYMFPSGALRATSNGSSERGQTMIALDSAQHTLQVLGEIMDRNVKMHYPGRADCTTSCAISRSEIHINGSQGTDAMLVGHELGHSIQMQQFGRDRLRVDYSKSGDGWNMRSDEWESSATQEGFATYVGVVSWYDPNNTATSPRGWNENFDLAQPVAADCADNRGVALQVAKAFWDMDDWNNEPGAGAASSWDDDLSYGTTGLVRGWSVFSRGTGNRDDFESGRDGVNMRDYYSNNVGRYTAPQFFETFIQHNCLQSQTNG